MSVVDIALLKQHVRADDFGGDDLYLEHLLGAAEEYVTGATARTIDELKEMGGGSLPPTLVQAVLLIAGHWYNQREAVSGTQMTEVPYTLQALVKPYRKLVEDEME